MGLANRGTCRRWGHEVNRAFRSFDPDDALGRFGLHRTVARQRRNPREGSDTVGAVVVDAWAPAVERDGRREALVSFRWAVQGHRIGSRLSVAFPAPQRGWFNTPGLLRGAMVRAQSESGVTRSVRGERVTSSVVCWVPPRLMSPCAARRVNWTSWHSRTSACRRAHSTGPSNTQMEPTRRTVLCDPVTTARGSFATLASQRPCITAHGMVQHRGDHANKESSALHRDPAITDSPGYDYRHGCSSR